MASRKKAQSISIGKLVSSIDDAVALASRRHGVALRDETFLDRWEIIGRVVREKIGLNAAYKLAEEITKGANLQGISALPVATRVGKDVLVGFVERATVPKILGK
jgi:hypothetical protein